MSIDRITRTTNEEDGAALRTDSKDAALADRLKADRRLKTKCARAGAAGGILLLCLLAIQVYAHVVDGPRIPVPINTIIAVVGLFGGMAWLIEWITRGVRRHILRSDGRGYGEGIMDGLSLRSSAGDTLDR
jgi:hypothetical protein